jgi:hypothetical protein
VQVWSIHDTNDSGLAFDLKDVLRALNGRLGQWTWCVTELDSLGGESEALCRAVEAARGAGVWLSSEELVRLADGIYQTIDGTFIAFSRGVDRQTTNAAAELAEFPNGKAELAICVIDGSVFEVYAKDAEIGELLRCSFRDVRTEDPSMYYW